MASIILPSKNENEIFGFNIGRCNVDYLDENLLRSEILEGKYDLCRLKLNSEDEMVSIKLSKTGFPFYFSGSIKRYRTKIDSNKILDISHREMIFEEYDGTQIVLLKEMLRGTWGTYPLGYYRTPILCELVNKELELESVFNFYRHNNLKANHPKNTILFMKDKGKYVGFFALNTVNSDLESHIGGILEPYRKDGYFLDMLTYIKNYCVENNLSHFVFGARNENAQVQKIFQDFGFKAIGTENVFHIIPFLSYTSTPKKQESLYIKKDFKSLVFEYLSKLNTKGRLVDLKIHELYKIDNDKEYIITHTVPIQNENETFFVFQLHFNNKCIAFAYCHYQQ